MTGLPDVLAAGSYSSRTQTVRRRTLSANPQVSAVGAGGVEPPPSSVSGKRSISDDPFGDLDPRVFNLLRGVKTQNSMDYMIRVLPWAPVQNSYWEEVK